MARPRKAELDAVRAMLEAEHPDVETLAAEVISALDTARATRTYYTVVTAAHGLAWNSGLYSTPGQAQKAVDRGLVPALNGSRLAILPVYPESVERGGGEERTCLSCGHPKVTHGFPKARKPCVVGSPLSTGRVRGGPEECFCGGFTC